MVFWNVCLVGTIVLGGMINGGAIAQEELERLKGIAYWQPPPGTWTYYDLGSWNVHQVWVYGEALWVMAYQGACGREDCADTEDGIDSMILMGKGECCEVSVYHNVTQGFRSPVTRRYGCGMWSNTGKWRYWPDIRVECFRWRLVRMARSWLRVGV